MTSKQAQKLYREATRGPKRTKAEQRQYEKAEQERIKRELKEEEEQRKKEAEASRARTARERKKAKDKDREDADRAARRHQGLPAIACRASQDTISRFFLRPRASKKRTLESLAEEDDKENADPVAEAKDTDNDEDTPVSWLLNDLPPPEPALKRQKRDDSAATVDFDALPVPIPSRPPTDLPPAAPLSPPVASLSPPPAPLPAPQPSPRRSRPFIEDNFSDVDLDGDEADVDALLAIQLASEANASQRCEDAAAPVTGSLPVAPIGPLPDVSHPLESLSLPGMDPPLENEPISTQLFVLGHIDLFPSASQEMRELFEVGHEVLAPCQEAPNVSQVHEDEGPMEVPAPYFISSQDFVLSTQDLCEVEKTTENTSHGIPPPRPTPSEAPSPSAGTEEPPPKKPFFTSSNRGAMDSLMKMHAVQASRRTFRSEEEARRLERTKPLSTSNPLLSAAEENRTLAASKMAPGKLGSPDRPASGRQAALPMHASQETDYGDIDLEEIETLELLDGGSDYIDDDEDWLEIL